MQNNFVILIAEDDAGHFELVKRNLWLSCFENEIVHFNDGREIIDYLEKNTDRDLRQAYVVLLDIKMPRLDGEQVLKKIRENSRLKTIPVIMLTTTSNPIEINRCYELGCNFYMVKPVNYHNFINAVENLGHFLSLRNLQVPQVK